MDNYVKGKNVETEETFEDVPIQDLVPMLEQNKVVWIKVRAGSKLKNLVGFAEKSFKDKGSVLFSGYGHGLSKAVSIAEIVKRR